jgi:hypothetical protein
VQVDDVLGVNISFLFNTNFTEIIYLIKYFIEFLLFLFFKALFIFLAKANTGSTLFRSGNQLLNVNIKMAFLKGLHLKDDNQL